MRNIGPAGDAHESPLTSPEPSEPPSIKRAIPKKRQRIESDDDEVNEPLSGDELPRPTTAGRRRAVYTSEDEADEEPPVTSQSQERFTSQRRDSPVSSTHEAPKKTAKKKAPPPSKARGKAKGDPPPAKKKAKKSRSKAVASSELSDDYEGLSDTAEESDAAMDVGSEEMSDMSEDYGTRKSKGKGKAGARNAGKKGVKETAIKAKDEGSRAPITPATSKGSKPLKVAAKGPPAPASDDMVVDVVGDSQSTRGGASTRPSSPSLPDDGGKTKEDLSSAAPVPPKKRKLPTIKKIKNLDSSGPGTPSSSGPKLAGDSKGTLGEMKPGAPTGSRLPAAMVGVADLDLMNKNVYNELFKGVRVRKPRAGNGIDLSHLF
ncbi:hypothetical protein H1R20_g5764, partial [Candolleomyces eurysporus]